MCWLWLCPLAEWPCVLCCHYIDTARHLAWLKQVAALHLHILLGHRLTKCRIPTPSAVAVPRPLAQLLVRTNSRRHATPCHAMTMEPADLGCRVDMSAPLPALHGTGTFSPRLQQAVDTSSVQCQCAGTCFHQIWGEVCYSGYLDMMNS